ncbi:GyrI-like domain-containing protein [Vallitalea guaymasensis]|uniref:GyrI-like domain-containing protein n=1 Tax=Vallitalea guaymasensis TaxID=1185412 RepID=A0A8J8MBC1_9FIRM|nr:GyrI-like domain-containing protein [Vallitalea guaymasensis]QUH29821.1 GyrI-like domain-containing protein [Vallitalea guaymasensis]
MKYDINIKDIEPIRVAAMGYKGNITQASRQFPNVFKSIRGKSNGAPFFAYYDIDKKNGIGELELCVPTGETPNSQGITIKELPRVRAACLTHIGGYDGLPKAYEAMRNYIEENNLKVQPPWREVYIKGPGLILKGNPDKYITEIIFPIEEGENNAGD